MNLKIGDATENGQVTIIDEDRLCYLVKSTSKGAVGVRTISKSLLLEYQEYLDKCPDTSANDARTALCGKSDIDKFEYGYTATLLALAKLSKNKVLSEYIRFKHLIEYFCAHLQYIVNRNKSIVGYEEYLKSYVDAGAFKISGQGWKGDRIQNQIKEWEKYDAGLVCINVYGSSFTSYASYLHWKGTGFNISANWVDNQIDCLQCVQYDENRKEKWHPLDTKFTLKELSLYDGKEPNENIKSLFDAFLLMLTSSEQNEELPVPLQQIFYGAPGTGKSHEVKVLTGELDSAGNECEKTNVFRTTFHPDTDYAAFVGCYKPTMKPTSKEEKTLTGKDEEIVYEFVPQVFTDAYIYAYNHPEEPTYLVIEEINRGNCAQIFGDLFQLLDRKEDGTSEYSIKADKDLAKYLLEGKNAKGEPILTDKDGIKDGKLRLPANLHILATMNTSDQSLFPMDSAFKRRWDWKYVAIDYNEHTSKQFEIILGEDLRYNWCEFIHQVNDRIFDLTKSEDKELGNFFIKNSVDVDQFKNKVMFYLWNEVLRDEVENSKYFFFYLDDKDNVHKFTFKDLYGENADTILEGFLKYILKGAE